MPVRCAADPAGRLSQVPRIGKCMAPLIMKGTAGKHARPCRDRQLTEHLRSSKLRLPPGSFGDSRRIFAHMNRKTNYRRHSGTKEDMAFFRGLRRLLDMTIYHLPVFEDSKWFEILRRQQDRRNSNSSTCRRSSKSTEYPWSNNIIFELPRVGPSNKSCNLKALLNLVTISLETVEIFNTTRFLLHSPHNVYFVTQFSDVSFRVGSLIYFVSCFLLYLYHLFYKQNFIPESIHISTSCLQDIDRHVRTLTVIGVSDCGFIAIRGV